MLLFSIFILLRGHNDPGGGFVGGLVAAAAFSLHAIAHSPADTRRLLPLAPYTLIGYGLLIAVSSGLYSLILGQSFMVGAWSERAFPAIGKIGTPFIFDIGVYMVVTGVVLTIIFTLREDI